jgi:phosphomevalonate kinase
VKVEVRQSAPGKLVLLGEYAVLFGHPAVVAAVDRRARVTLRPAADHAFQVTAPGIVDRPCRFDLAEDGVPRWTDDEAPRRLGLVENVLASMTAEGLIARSDLIPFSAVLDTSRFFQPTEDGPSKLGLGSSAALTVSFAAAVARWAGHDELLRPPMPWLRQLVRFHRDFQRGRGSGVDLAAGLLGGTLLFQLDEGGDVLRADPIRLPAGLVMRFVWTGRSADTGRFLDQLSARMTTNRDGIIRALEQLGAIAESGIDALIEGHVDDFLDAADASCDGMDRLGSECDLAIVSDVHRELRCIARECGTRYKPSGAGGGDIGLLLTDDPDRATAAAAAVRRAGFRIVDASIDPIGLA